MLIKKLILKILKRADKSEWVKKHKINDAIIVIGDSHSSFFSGNEMPVFKKLIKSKNKLKINSCEDKLEDYCTAHVGPALAYNLNKYNTTTMAREKIEYLISTNLLKPDAKILCAFGEIDIRLHVYKIVEKTGKSYKDIIDNILECYLEFLLFLKSKGYNVGVWGPICQIKDVDINDYFPVKGTEIERNKATIYFNNQLEELCKQHNLKYMSICDKLINENFESDLSYLCPDRGHLGQKAWQLVEEKYGSLKTVFEQ